MMEPMTPEGHTGAAVLRCMSNSHLTNLMSIFTETNNMGKTTKEKVQGWIKSSVKSMLAEEDGAVYFYDIKGGISLMLAWIDGETESENKFCHRKYTIEASVRKTGSSSFAEEYRLYEWYGKCHRRSK